MGIKVSGLELVKAKLREVAPKAERASLDALDRAGRRLVEIARASKSYQDRTGNLTASIGYGVYQKGQAYSVGGFGGGEGEQRGRLFLEELAALNSSSQFALFVVAGMDYAAYVERKGNVVLDGAMLRTESVVAEELKQISVSI